jgi:H+-transporting ATPase
MKENEHVTENKPGSKPDAKDDLKSLPMSELQAKLGSSPEGLGQAETQKRLTQYGHNEIEEKKPSPGIWSRLS